jgi:hypothetical protein
MDRNTVFFPIDKIAEMGKFLAELTFAGIAYTALYRNDEGWFIKLTGF